MLSSIATRNRLVAVVLLALGGILGSSWTAWAVENPWRVGLASVAVTPECPIAMAGYAARKKSSEGVLAYLYVKAMAIEDSGGQRAVLLTADLIGFRASLAEAICKRIREKTGLARRQILIAPSHTHAGPILGEDEAAGSGLSQEQIKTVESYTRKLPGKLAGLAVAALADMRPARLSWGTGTADFVMNRRERKQSGNIELGVNREGYVDPSVPVLRVDGPDGALRALIFGCACHNTTLGGDNLQICGDYAGFAQQYVQQQHPGVQAMFIIGCGGDANPYPRATVELVRQHGQTLGTEVCRVAAAELQPVRGPLRMEIDWADLPLAPPQPREQLQQMLKGSSWRATNAKRMLEALDRNEPLPTQYRAPVAVWQFGADLTLVALSGEVVSDYVPLVQKAIGPERLWIAGYTNDDFGYLPSAKVLAEGGYETRGLIGGVGYFAPQVQDVVVAKVRQLAQKVGRTFAY